jgi:hypothetical protein
VVGGPTINTALLNQQVPRRRAGAEHGPDVGQPDRVNPHTTSTRLATSASSPGSLAVSADYVHQNSRDMLMALNLNPLFRATPNVNTSGTVRIGSPALTEGGRSCSSSFRRPSHPSAGR